MITTLNGIFSVPKPPRVDFIKENKKKLKEASNMVNQNSSKSRFDVTKSKSSQTNFVKSMSGTSTHFKETRTHSTCESRLSGKGSVGVFSQKDKGSISNISLSPKQKSSQKVSMFKNQSSQTIDPRRCDQLYHEGVIKYPSNKILQELAEIKKQKANRLDAHVKKEFFRRNKVKQKNPNKIIIPKINNKVSGKGDEGDIVSSDTGGDEEEEEEEENKITSNRKVVSSETVVTKKPVKPSPPPLTMRAAEIIKRTTEEHINYSPKSQLHSDHVPNSKGDAKPIRKQPKKLTREEEVLKTVLDPNCPPGHIPLPDAERKKTLHMLRVSHAELVREMNLLPVRADTLRIRQRKIHLENQLNKIEEGIKVFNKSKVYVKIEE